MQGKKIAVIPARGGSRRVRKKNLQRLGGKPVLVYTVEAALRAGWDAVVSTEDPDIAAVAHRAGATVIPQPLNSALSGTMSAPVVLAALNYVVKAFDAKPELVALLHPTSPFRSAAHIKEAEIMLGLCKESSVISFTDDDLNGAIYMASVGAFRRSGSFFGVKWIIPYHMTAHDGLDIDTWEDLDNARRQMGAYDETVF